MIVQSQCFAIWTGNTKHSPIVLRGPSVTSAMLRPQNMTTYKCKQEMVRLKALANHRMLSFHSMIECEQEFYLGSALSSIRSWSLILLCHVVRIAISLKEMHLHFSMENTYLPCPPYVYACAAHVRTRTHRIKWSEVVMHLTPVIFSCQTVEY